VFSAWIWKWLIREVYRRYGIGITGVLSFYDSEELIHGNIVKTLFVLIARPLNFDPVDDFGLPESNELSYGICAEAASTDNVFEYVLKSVFLTNLDFYSCAQSGSI